MNCREARRWLSPYLDSELDQSTTFAISEHLRLCADCRSRFDAEREIDRKLSAGLNAGPIPDDLWRQVVRPLRQPRWSGRRVFLPLAAAAAVGLIAWLGWSLQPAAPEAHWMIAEFLEETNGGEPFESPARMNNSEATSVPLEPFADLAMSLVGEHAQGHAVQFVSVDTVQGADGGDVIEVRLNCCGEPVILHVARRDQPGHLREFTDGDAARFAALSAGQEVALAGRTVGDYVVVGVSSHSLSNLLMAVHTQ